MALITKITGFFGVQGSGKIGINFPFSFEDTETQNFICYNQKVINPNTDKSEIDIGGLSNIKHFYLKSDISIKVTLTVSSSDIDLEGNIFILGNIQGLTNIYLSNASTKTANVDLIISGD